MLRIAEKVLQVDKVLQTFEMNPNTCEVHKAFYFDEIDYFIIDFIYNQEINNERTEFYAEVDELKASLNRNFKSDFDEVFINEKLFRIVGQGIFVECKKTGRTLSACLYSGMEHDPEKMRSMKFFNRLLISEFSYTFDEKTGKYFVDASDYFDEDDNDDGPQDSGSSKIFKFTFSEPILKLFNDAVSNNNLEG